MYTSSLFWGKGYKISVTVKIVQKADLKNKWQRKLSGEI